MHTPKYKLTTCCGGESLFVVFGSRQGSAVRDLVGVQATCSRVGETNRSTYLE